MASESGTIQQAVDGGTGRDAELVVLLAEDGTPLGTQEKATVHTLDTPLHLAFSTHVFDADGRILVTRRALGKKAWPGVWTNSFCGHPAPGEDFEDAVHRRAAQELGFTVTDVRAALPDFRYRAVDAGGIVENEICPVYTAVADSAVAPLPEEVMDYQWVDAPALVRAVTATPWAFSPWLTLQLPLLYPQGADGPGPHRG
ncbi:isopentenyl-diphosphate delta-isomerase [Arthrobacter pityocampae]|uniref:Isopentenyl-diphosphate Delta-isomerase n=1 Tax=Arthrobacter pityocampae TaxID=547334 RepID=A0A2S5IWL0_9MICC|nr:isopentenyl-diphosphate Delta-isomerase [Arthrobacter pityocampae]PPB48935.1 isopentenyl-diphosphate delta-isomerase [Arthrobacter pityocampae]